MIEVSKGTTVPPAQLWAAVTDIEAWPEWTESMTAVTRLDDGPLRVGSQARVEQPRMRPMVWEVTRLIDGEEFTWQARTAGVVTTGRHAVHADGAGARLELSVEHRGALAGLIRLLSDRRSRRYIEWEAAGLVAAAESSG